jgi:glycosyltransferase involved in cell wall biosynthesis
MAERQDRGAYRLRKVCLPCRLSGTGGPASFQRRLTAGLAQRGIEVIYDLSNEPYDVVLVINSTRNLARLQRCKKRGVRIIQRLGGVNWLHQHLPVGIHGYILAEIRNWMMRMTRYCLADHIIYQSRFVKEWWERGFGVPLVPSNVIYNGVDLATFNPCGPKYQSHADVCIISVEGTQGADPFDIAIKVAQSLRENGLNVELLMFGSPWKNARARYNQYPFVTFKGPVPNAELPYYYRGASFYVSTDIIAACPNSVLEALACGTPVLGYKAGVLPEIVDGSAGHLVEAPGDPFKGESPGNEHGFVKAALDLLDGLDRFRQGARSSAESQYGLNHMINKYCDILFEEEA